MNYRISEKRGFIIVGMKYYGDNANNEIQTLWESFDTRMDEITTRINKDTVFGYDTWTDEINNNGKFTYFAGVEVSDDSCIPDGMEVISIPSNKYAIFDIDKKSPSIDAVVKGIFSEIIPKEGLVVNGNYDFEYMNNQDIIYFHVPVK